MPRAELRQSEQAACHHWLVKTHEVNRMRSHLITPHWQTIENKSSQCGRECVHKVCPSHIHPQTCQSSWSEEENKCAQIAGLARNINSNKRQISIDSANWLWRNSIWRLLFNVQSPVSAWSCKSKWKYKKLGASFQSCIFKFSLTWGLGIQRFASHQISCNFVETPKTSLEWRKIFHFPKSSIE